jgi:predicted alpha/beta-hydrolase family hydrolase
VLLAPGASGTIAGLRGHLRALAGHGIEAHAVQLPRGSAERAIPVYRRALARHTRGSTVIGGHSFGGRVASFVAAETPPLGLVLLSYPLHRPGNADSWRERTSHWPRIECPVLLLSGEADPFARIELLREAVLQLPHHQLVTYPGVRHGIGPVLEDAMQRVADWIADLPG